MRLERTIPPVETGAPIRAEAFEQRIPRFGSMGRRRIQRFDSLPIVIGLTDRVMSRATCPYVVHRAGGNRQHLWRVLRYLVA